MNPDRKRLLVIFALAGSPCALIGASAAAAQDTPLVVEGRGGATFPVADFRTGPESGGEIARAPSFGVHFVYRGPSGWGPYVGFSQHRFDCSADGCPSDEYVLTTWDLGVQRTIGGVAWTRVAMLFGRLERNFPAGFPPAADSGPPVHATSSLSLGGEAGLGLRLSLGARMGLRPGVRYGWLNTRFRGGDLVRMRWLTVDLGVALGF